MAAKWIKHLDGKKKTKKHLSGLVVLCHQEGSFQVWAKFISSVFSLFFPFPLFLRCQSYPGLEN